MAQEVQLANTSDHGKIRNPLGVIGLALITFDIYAMVWYYKTNKEMATIGQANGTDEAGTSPGLSLLAVTLGIFLIVPPFVSYYKFTKRLQKTEQLVGVRPGMDPGLLFLLLVFLGPVGVYIAQANLNKALEGQSQLGGASAGAPAIATA